MKALLILFFLVTSAAYGAAFTSGGIKHDITTQATAAGTTTLTLTSNQVQDFTGATTQTVVLPDATTLKNGYWYKVNNFSTGLVTVQDNGLNVLQVLTSTTVGSAYFYLVSNASTDGTWSIQPISVGGGLTDLTTDVTGILPIGSGGTSTSQLPNDGQLLIGGGSTYTPASLAGTSDQVIVVEAANSITLSTPQSIATSSSPTFAGLTVGSATGNVYSTAGVLGTSTISLLEVSGILPIGSGGTNAGTSTAAFNNLSPLGAPGDLLIVDSTGANIKLPVGTDTQVLTVNAANADKVEWATAAGGGSDPADFSAILLLGLNGYGSSDLAINRYTTVVDNINNTVDWTFADSATLGTTITIINTGIYCFSMTYAPKESADRQYGISQNATGAALDVSPVSTDSTTIALQLSANDTSDQRAETVSACVSLVNGDVIRPHGDAVSSQVALHRFSGARVH